MSEKNLWNVDEWESSDKRITINGPNETTLYVDYDDVNHAVVDQMIQKMLTCLNHQVQNLFWNVAYPKEYDCGCETLDGELVEDCDEGAGCVRFVGER